MAREEDGDIYLSQPVDRGRSTHHVHSSCKRSVDFGMGPLSVPLYHCSHINEKHLCRLFRPLGRAPVDGPVAISGGCAGSLCRIERQNGFALCWHATTTRL